MAASITTGSTWPSATIFSSVRLGQEAPDSASGESSMRWLLKHNQSISPAHFLAVFAVLAVLSSVIAIGFWMAGATLVLPFVGAELLALGGAILFHVRHATDCEDIRLGPQGLTVILRNGRNIVQVDFQPQWVRVERERHEWSLIALCGQGQCVFVGRFVRPERRRQLAEEIRRALRRWQPGVA